MIRLVATDLDGTLLDPQGHISPRDAATLLDAARAGVRVVVATGRPWRWLDCLAPLAGVAPLVIVSNGAAVYDLAGQRCVRRQALSTRLCDDLATDVRAVLPEAVFGLEQGDVFGCEPGWRSTPPDASRTAEQESADTVRAPWSRLLADVGPVLKMLVLAPGSRVENLAATVAEVAGERAVVTHSAAVGHAAMVEVSAAGVTKASALAQVCAELGVPRSEVAAFGDMPNDADMLAWAGHGFAMDQAHPSLRARFPSAGSNADGGVGRTLARLLAAQA